MLGNDVFRYDLLRKYSLTFGALFNEISVTHRDANGAVARTIKVPLTYAPKEKVLARVLADPAIDRQAATILPRISFELTSMSYNGTRKLPSVRKHYARVSDDKDVLTSVLNPVPYDLRYTLWVYTKYQEDHNSIVEQIAPFFVPNFTATIELMPGLLVDTQVNLDTINTQDVYAGDFNKRRAIMTTMEFTVAGYLFGPERRTPVIKFANSEFYVPGGSIDSGIGNTAPIDKVTVQPGMDANGDPTTNVSISVDYHEIKADDDWDYAVTIFGSLVPGDVGEP